MPHRSVNRLGQLHSAVWIAMAFVVAGCFTSVVRVALANHYHCDSGICHGFVHGESLTDGSFFSRTREGTAPRGCQIDTVNNPGGYRTRIIGDYYCGG